MPEDSGIHRGIVGGVAPSLSSEELWAKRLPRKSAFLFAVWASWSPDLRKGGKVVRQKFPSPALERGIAD